MLLNIFTRVLAVSIGGGVIALTLLIIRALLWRKLPARVQYGMWMILLIRLLVPAAPQSPLSLFSLTARGGLAQSLQPAVSAFTAGPMPQIIQPAGASGVTPAPLAGAAAGFSPGFNAETAAILWLVVAAVLLVYILAVNLVISLRLGRLTACRDPELLAELAGCRTRMNVRCRVEALNDPRIHSPAVFGLLHPRILLPLSFEKELGGDGFQYVLMHEMTHIRRRDNIISLLALMLCAVNWFNPVLWYAFYRMKEDCEISCDAAVLEKLSGDERHAYGSAMISVIRMTAPAGFALGTIGFADRLSKRRIMMIAQKKKASICWIAAALTAVLIAGCSSLPAKENAGTPPLKQDSGVTQTSGSNSSAVSSISSSASSDNDSYIVKGEDFISFVNGRNYKILTNSLTGGYVLQMPGSFGELKNGYAIGSFLKARNELSKGSGFDFSPYLGKALTLYTCFGEKRKAGDTELTEDAGGPGTAEIIALYEGKNVVGFWTVPLGDDKSSSDLNTLTNYLAMS